MMTMAELTQGNVIPVAFMDNLNKLLYRMSVVRYMYGQPMKVNSGFRTPEHNKKVNGSPTSHHMSGAAVDIADKDGSLYLWCQSNVALLGALGLWCEDRLDTQGWVHFQIYPPKSGNRFFRK